MKNLSILVVDDDPSIRKLLKIKLIREFSIVDEAKDGHSSVDTAIEAMKKGANDYLEKPINFDELFLRLDKIASMQTILRTAEDLQHTMNTTESAASTTIQYLEIEVHRLQNTLESVEKILHGNREQDTESIIEIALEKISEAQKQNIS